MAGSATLTYVVDDTDRARRTVERYCEAWVAGDLDALLGCYADDFTLHYFGTSRFAGDHAGRAASLAVLAEVSTAASRVLVAVDEILVGVHGAAVVVRERLSRDGESHELRRVLRYRIRGDELTECWLYDEDQALVDRLWA